MTHKAIRYSAHASQRMQMRGISRADVRYVLARGTVVEIAGTEDVHAKRVLVGGEALVVWYKEGATGIYVVTVYFEH